jgi:hypothetical protein
MPEWIVAKCACCGGQLFVRNDWKSPPDTCSTCKVKKVEGIRQLLQSYLRSMEAIEARPMDQEDRQALNRSRSIRRRILGILNSCDSEQDEANKLADDNDICKLILRLDKQRTIRARDSKRYKAQKGKLADLTAISIVQGGAPGLGKKA